MERERTVEIIAAYGADPARWPPQERDDVRAALSADFPLRRQAEDAASLDALLGAWAVQGPGDDEAAARAAAEAVLRSAGRPHRRWLSAGMFGGAGIAAAFAAALLLSPLLSDKPVALPQARTAAVQVASSTAAASTDTIDSHLWSMTFTPTQDEESLI